MNYTDLTAALSIQFTFRRTYCVNYLCERAPILSHITSFAPGSFYGIYGFYNRPSDHLASP